jgi:hypothetical protein
MKQPILLSLFAVAAAPLAFGAPIVTYDFQSVTDPGLSGDNNAIALVSASSDANVGDSGITGAGGLEIYRVRDPNGAYGSLVLLSANDDQGADTAAAFANNGYFSFTVTPDSGFEMDLTSLDFLVATGGTTETRLYEIRSDLTGVTSLAGPVSPTGTRNDGKAGMDNISIDLTGISALQNLTTAVTFQFITATTGNFNASLEWDDISLNGTVSVVPEPSTYAMLAGLLALGWVMFRRRLRE